MYLLDSDTVIYSLKGHPSVVENLALHADDPLGVSTVTLMELYYGAFKSQQAAANLAKVRAIEGSVRVWDLEADTAEVFGMLKVQLEHDGNRLDDFDLAIAACALAHNLTLVTNNSSHFARIPGLRVVNWATPTRK